MANNINYGSINASTSASSFSPTESLTRQQTAELKFIKDSIAGNLQKIQSNTQKLEKASLNRTENNHEVRNKMSVIQNSTNSIINELRNSITSLVKLSSDKNEKLQSKKIVADFNLVIKKYLEAEKSLNAKLKNTVLVNMDDDDDDDNNDVQPGINQEQIQSQNRDNYKFENDLLAEREDRVKRLEVDVIDANQIMKELSSLVSDQGEDVQRIEDIINDVTINVGEGVVELRKAESYQQKHRKKVLILLLICIIVALIISLSIYFKA